jgi:hypothetical protein
VEEEVGDKEPTKAKEGETLFVVKWDGKNGEGSAEGKFEEVFDVELFIGKFEVFFAVGVINGTEVGKSEGYEVEKIFGSVGKVVGSTVGVSDSYIFGFVEGTVVSMSVGKVIGSTVGVSDEYIFGLVEGTVVSKLSVGKVVGSTVGVIEGTVVSKLEGSTVGISEGNCDGDCDKSRILFPVYSDTKITPMVFPQTPKGLLIFEEVADSPLGPLIDDPVPATVKIKFRERSTIRILFPDKSVMNRKRPSISPHKQVGFKKDADVGLPPSPKLPAVPLPAKVDNIWLEMVSILIEK